MKFELKDMYKFLLSHTFPGLLLGVEIILGLHLLTDVPIEDLLKKTWSSNSLLLIISGYVLSTLLGFIVDGIHHYYYDEDRNQMQRDGFPLFWKPDTNAIKDEAVKYSKRKFQALRDEHSLTVYKHFVEDDLFYPSEAYANIGIAMVPGWLLLIYVFIRELLESYSPLKFSWQFHFAHWFVTLLIIIIYTYFMWVMLYEARHTWSMHEMEEEQFVTVFSNENAMHAEIVRDYDPEVLQDIMVIERGAFPERWIETDAESQYKTALSTSDNINIILTTQGKRVGYLLAVPHNDAVHDLKGDDPEMKEELQKYYVQTVGILREYRKRKGLPTMLNKLIDECKKRGINKISMHARVRNGLSQMIQNELTVTEKRRIPKWKYYNFEEPTDYIEATIS